jgi:hypothetical protein
MPHWTKGKTDIQRGDGVFDKSIKALQELNAVGYGMPGSGLKLDLVYNPSGAFFTRRSIFIRKDFKKALKKILISNFIIFCYYQSPISRF